ncbi:peptidase M23-like protein [Streptomyces sp. KhCrAH-43]|uniref:peptidoglycan DD-metalloendopeptidase family protein n=1 Tax=unclassified Streptomyces TaxID=2593676 RepID=UPI0003643E62|nr:M23 family metallopeptidase [Streptomyces sp. KhCrAH-43]MYS34169.1 peptidoglycan DD-metalloendopeptidase family protein [Streptomyces sp. SID4920]MYX67204.1 peptidoglycan DD-metalloendopeptidase family protein [Streptomyces sp. SID8373]RAJ43769.1 peptidase M23-like protein [Streptomyces sp. KhCrAH-43]
MRFLGRLPALAAAALLALVGLSVSPAHAGEVGVTATPVFKAPFPCGQRWTYSHHSAEVRRALDFVRVDGGATAGTPVLASAAGTATQYSQPSGAGNYIVVDHGAGWKTYYFHLSAFAVASGTYVSQGQQVGTTGSTGNSTGAHIHYEQLYNGVGQNIVINGAGLPYPGSYNQAYLTSDNGCGGSGTPFTTWGSGVRVRADARLSAPVVTTLGGPTAVRVLCQKQGDTVNAEGYTNNWWSKLRDQNGFISNIYIDHPSAQLPGVPLC